MAESNLAELSPGLNLYLPFSLENLSTEDLRERMFFLLEQLNALVHVAACSEFHDRSERVVYCYLTVVNDHLHLLESVCERLVSQAMPAFGGSTT